MSERRNFKNKPENSFQNYDLAKNEPVCQNKLIQPSEMQKPETGQKTGPGPTGKFSGQTSMLKEIYFHKKIFDTTIRSTKTGNRTENRTLDQLEIFMNKLECQYKFVCIEIFPKCPAQLLEL